MKRKQFIQTIFATAKVPLFAFSQNQKAITRADKGFTVKAGEGRIQGHLKFFIVYLF